jgi:hypothetical protein
VVFDGGTRKVRPSHADGAAMRDLVVDGESGDMRVSHLIVAAWRRRPMGTIQTSDAYRRSP